MQNSANNEKYLPTHMMSELLENSRKICTEATAKIVAPLNTAKKIDNAVEKYASRYFKTDKDFEGETLEEYKEYMRQSLYKYVILSLDVNSKVFDYMSFDEINKHMLYVKNKYREMFMQFIYDRV